MRLSLAPVLCLLAAVVLLGGCAATPRPERPVAVASTASVPTAHDRSVARALAVLHRWDERRARAYASGDSRLLRRLYVRGSVARARDVRTLEEYAARGLTVEGLTMQVLRARVLEASRTRLRIRLLDRVAGGTATSGSSHVELPADRPTRRTVTIVRRGDRWLVRAVRPG